MPKKILILLDSPSVRSEVKTYSVELARRMGARVHLLMLLRWEAPSVDRAAAAARDSEGAEIGSEAETVLQDCVNEIRSRDVDAVGSMRQGDPASELLKYLAEYQPFQAVVWGGSEAYIRRRRTPVRTHWLERIREQLDCTLVVPSLRREKAESG